MNNRFKFRAWDTKNKKWLEFIPPQEYMLDAKDWDHHDLDEFACLKYPNNLFNDFNGRIVYQQCTGKQDKNGVLIFEGDIIRGEEMHFSEKELEFKSLGECVGHVWYYCSRPDWVVSFNHLYSETSTDFNSIWSPEVVGNIFMNENLLKENFR